MSASFMSIGGIASGLDTAGIIDQLLRLERRPIQVIQQRQEAHRRADQAWQSVTTKLSSLRGAIDALRDPSSFQRDASVTTSSPQVAGARVTGTPAVGTTDLEVLHLATSHSVAVGGSFVSRDAAFGATEVTVTRADGSTATVTLADGATLEDAARALSDVEGITARIVRTGTDAHRLVLGASTTGEEARFGVVAGALSTETLQLGEDARLRVGGLDVTRATNVVDDLVDGVELSLSGTGTVRIGVERDLDASVGRVKALVDGVNGVLAELKKVSATSTDAAARGPLAGDRLVRDLAMSLREVVATVAGEGTYGTPSSIGISLTRDGALAFDEAALRTALAADPAAVAAMVSSVTRATDPAVSVTASGRAAAGTYQLQVTQAGTAASVLGAAYAAPPPGGTHTFTLTTAAGTEVALLLDDTVTDAAAAAATLTAQLRDAGVTEVTVTDDGGGLRVEHARAGADRGFTIAGSGTLGLDGTVAGTDAQGTLSDGTTTWTLVGTGTSLRVADGPVAGLVLGVARGAVGDLGEVTVADGLTSAFDRVVRSAEGIDGRIRLARDSIEARIDQARVAVERAENRFVVRERTLRAQFTGLETALANLQAQGNWLAGQLASFNA